jgi:FtsP/CotA-like multicopper oxidase with cupredoxin domain
VWFAGQGLEGLPSPTHVQDTVSKVPLLHPAHTHTPRAHRQVIVVNGQPFPNLYVDVGDRVIVHVTNLLNEPLSVHW